MAVGVPMNSLPKIVSNSQVHGKVKGFGILDGITISGTLGDQMAALLGQGCLEVGSSKNTYGTGCFMLLNTGHEPKPSSSGLLTTVGYQLGPGEPITFALEGAVACAGRTVQWLRDNLGMIQDAVETESLAGSVEDSSGVTLVPAFSGLFAPHWRDDARAVLVGMSLFTKREHIVRATLESVAFSTVDVVEAMKKDTGVELGVMYVDGGMTMNSLFMQIQTDLLGTNVMRAKMPEATVFGSALAAGLAVGFYKNVTDVKEFLAKAGGHETFVPKMSAEVRSAECARWNDAVRRTFDLAQHAKQ
jgi:glycerol kinase